MGRDKQPNVANRIHQPGQAASADEDPCTHSTLRADAPAFVPSSPTLWTGQEASLSSGAPVGAASVQSQSLVADEPLGQDVGDASAERQPHLRPAGDPPCGGSVAPCDGSDSDALVSDMKGDGCPASYELLLAGDLVLIEGLRGATHLNGRQGAVLEDSHRIGADGRVGVRVSGVVKPVRVKLENLRRLGVSGDDFHRGCMPLRGYSDQG